MRSTLKAKMVLVVLLATCAAGCVTHSKAAYDGALTFTLENDLCTGSDNNYTNGVGVAWVSSDLATYDEQREDARFGTLSMSWYF